MAQRVLFVDHEVRLSGGQRDLVDLVRALGDAIDVHAALPANGPLADELRGLGVQVHVIAMGGRLRRLSRWQIARRPYVALPHIASFLASTLRLAALARRLRPDVVHTNSMKAHLMAVLAARTSGAALVWHVRDILEPGWLRNVVCGIAGLAADRVIAISAAAAAPFRVGRTARRTTIVYNGIDPRPYDDIDLEVYRRKLGADGDEPLVGIVGQIAHWKGQDVFVEAAARIAEQLPHARFAVVGGCLYPENEARFEAAVQERIAELGLTDRLAWTGPLDRIEPVMAALDVFVHASRLPEPFGRVVVEALAQGTPVVTTTAGAGVELVPVGASRVVRPGDPVAVADAVLELLADTDNRDATVALAQSAAARFSTAATAAGVRRTYREVTS